MILDMELPLEIDRLYIYGRLTVDPNLSKCVLKANWIIVQSG